MFGYPDLKTLEENLVLVSQDLNIFKENQHLCAKVLYSTHFVGIQTLNLNKESFYFYYQNLKILKENQHLCAKVLYYTYFLVSRP